MVYPMAKIQTNSRNPTTLFVRLWQATSLRGQAIPSGSKVGIPRCRMHHGRTSAGVRRAVSQTARGVPALEMADAKSPAERDKAWQKWPHREGESADVVAVSLLRDPVTFRPGVILRMPKFNYREGDVEALANYFAAADNVPYPYVSVPDGSEAIWKRRTSPASKL